MLRRVTVKWPHVPVVMITAFNDSKTAARALEESAADYVSKPFELRHLERVVAAQMNRNPSRTVLPPDLADIWVE